MPEEELIIAVKEGDAEAFKTLFLKYYKPMCMYLRSYTNDLDSAQEIAQVSFIKFWEKRNEIKIHTSFKSYIFKMGYYQFLENLRKNKNQITLLDELKHQVIIDEEHRSKKEQEYTNKRLKNIISTLPSRCQEVLRLRLQGYKYKEIATKLDISVKTVESQMRIAFIKIRDDFGEY